MDEKGIVEIGGVNILSDGNALVITGPPKGRKTFLASVLVKKTGLKTAYIDSEQGWKHSWRTGQFIPNSDVFHLRGEDHQEITRVIHECANCGEYQLMVIDNGRDLVQDFNDVKESGKLELLIKKVSEQLPLIIIIHENKNNSKGQGHAGYGLTKIAQTTIRVSLIDVEDPAKGSIVECVYSRDEPFSRVWLSLDGTLSNGTMIKGGGRAMSQEEFFSSLGDTEYSRDELMEKIAEIFGTVKRTAANIFTDIKRACPGGILERKEGKRKFYHASRNSQ